MWATASLGIPGTTCMGILPTASPDSRRRESSGFSPDTPSCPRLPHETPLLRRSPGSPLPPAGADAAAPCRRRSPFCAAGPRRRAPSPPLAPSAPPTSALGAPGAAPRLAPLRIGRPPPGSASASWESRRRARRLARLRSPFSSLSPAPRWPWRPGTASDWPCVGVQQGALEVGDETDSGSSV